MNQIKCAIASLLSIGLAAVILILFLSPKVYGIENGQNSRFNPQVGKIALNATTGQIGGKKTILREVWQVYTQAQIDELTENTENPIILRKLIGCESQNTNVARMDSNHQMSYGILQFNGKATWNEYAPLAGITGSPMNPAEAIKVADYMISNGELHRWTCAHILKLL